MQCPFGGVANIGKTQTWRTGVGKFGRARHIDGDPFVSGYEFDPLSFGQSCLDFQAILQTADALLWTLMDGWEEHRTTRSSASLDLAKPPDFLAHRLTPPIWFNTGKSVASLTVTRISGYQRFPDRLDGLPGEASQLVELSRTQDEKSQEPALSAPKRTKWAILDSNQWPPQCECGALTN